MVECFANPREHPGVDAGGAKNFVYVRPGTANLISQPIDPYTLFFYNFVNLVTYMHDYCGGMVSWVNPTQCAPLLGLLG